MTAVIVYDGEAARLVAQAVELGLGGRLRTQLRDVGEADAWALGADDLLVVGAEGRGRTMPVGLQGWLPTLHLDHTAFAVFTTRAAPPAHLTCSAASAISLALSHAGGDRLAHRVAFLVDASGDPARGELVYARDWGRQLGDALNLGASHRVGVQS